MTDPAPPTGRRHPLKGGSRIKSRNAADPALPVRWRCPLEGGWRSDTKCAKTGGEPGHANAASVSISTLLPARAVFISVAVSGNSLAK
ncbi:MAG: hypothetical protein EOO22_15890 [Comamonadaceae bacterium]|nr:MAG: hypothetical protein EOO22_15890 [Comamonadaceae bacterium]